MRIVFLSDVQSDIPTFFPIASTTIKNITSDIYIYGNCELLKWFRMALFHASDEALVVDDDVDLVSTSVGGYSIQFSVYQHTLREQFLGASLFGQIRLIVIDMSSRHDFNLLENDCATKTPSWISFATAFSYEALSIMLVGIQTRDTQYDDVTAKELVTLGAKLAEKNHQFCGVALVNTKVPASFQKLLQVLGHECLWLRKLIKHPLHFDDRDALSYIEEPLPSALKQQDASEYYLALNSFSYELEQGLLCLLGTEKPISIETDIKFRYDGTKKLLRFSTLTKALECLKNTRDPYILLGYKNETPHLLYSYQYINSQIKDANNHCLIAVSFIDLPIDINKLFIKLRSIYKIQYAINWCLPQHYGLVASLLYMPNYDGGLSSPIPDRLLNQTKPLGYKNPWSKWRTLFDSEFEYLVKRACELFLIFVIDNKKMRRLERARAETYHLKGIHDLSDKGLALIEFAWRKHKIILWIFQRIINMLTGKAVYLPVSIGQIANTLSLRIKDIYFGTSKWTHHSRMSLNSPQDIFNTLQADELRNFALECLFCNKISQAASLDELERLIALRSNIMLPKLLRRHYLTPSIDTRGAMVFSFFFLSPFGIPQVNHVQINMCNTVFHAYWNGDKKGVGLTRMVKYPSYQLLFMPKKREILPRLFEFIDYLCGLNLDFNVAEMQAAIRKERNEMYGAIPALSTSHEQKIEDETILPALEFLFYYFLKPNLVPLNFKATGFFCSWIVCLIYQAAFLADAVEHYIKHEVCFNNKHELMPDDLIIHTKQMWRKKGPTFFNLPSGLICNPQNVTPMRLLQQLQNDPDDFIIAGYCIS